jgi:protein-tyrosine phosphatase
MGSLRDWLREKYGDNFDGDSALLGVDASYLHAAWTSVDRNFGSFDGYLMAIGVDPDTQDAIRARLLG